VLHHLPRLLRVGIFSENVLRGIIFLLFEKAIREPRYCPMYAQVCHRLSQDAPTFEDPHKAEPGAPKTFLRLLLLKCQDEFDKRLRASHLAAGACGSDVGTPPPSLLT